MADFPIISLLELALETVDRVILNHCYMYNKSRNSVLVGEISIWRK